MCRAAFARVDTAQWQTLRMLGVTGRPSRARTPPIAQPTQRRVTKRVALARAGAASLRPSAALPQAGAAPACTDVVRAHSGA